MKKLMSLVLLGLVSTTAMAQEKPLYARAGLLTAFGDLRSYAGGATTGYGVEFGYTLPMKEEIISFAAYAGYIGISGKARAIDPYPLIDDSIQTAPKYMPVYQAKQSMKAWRLGVDAVFVTPMDKLRAFAGININGFNGTREVVGTPTEHEFEKDSRGKFGARAGLEYQITNEVAVTAEYNVAAWRSEIQGLRPVRGVNPVNPSWTTLSVQYRFGR